MQEGNEGSIVMDLDGVRSFIDKQSWIFAKTYTNRAPHEYVVRGRVNGTDEEFMSVVNYIQEKGITIPWINRSW